MAMKKKIVSAMLAICLVLGSFVLAFTVLPAGAAPTGTESWPNLSSKVHASYLNADAVTKEGNHAIGATATAGSYKDWVALSTVNDGEKDAQKGWIFCRHHYDEGGDQGSGAGNGNAWLQLEYENAVFLNRIVFYARWTDDVLVYFPKKFYITAKLADGSDIIIADFTGGNGYADYEKYGEHIFRFPTIKVKSVRLVCTEPDRDQSGTNGNGDDDLIYSIVEFSTFGTEPVATDNGIWTDISSGTNATHIGDNDDVIGKDGGNHSVGAAVTTGGHNGGESMPLSTVNDGIKAADKGWYFSRGQYDEGGANGSGAGKHNAWLKLEYADAEYLDKLIFNTKWAGDTGGVPNKTYFPKRFYITAELADGTTALIADYTGGDGYADYDKYGKHVFTFPVIKVKSVKLICVEPDRDLSDTTGYQNYSEAYWIAEFSTFGEEPKEEETDDWTTDLSSKVENSYVDADGVLTAEDGNHAIGATVTAGVHSGNMTDHKLSTVNDGIKDAMKGWYISRASYDEGGQKGSGASKDKAWLKLEYSEAVYLDKLILYAYWSGADKVYFPKKFFITAVLDDDTTALIVNYNNDAGYPNYTKYGMHIFEFPAIKVKSIKLVCTEPDRDLSDITGYDNNTPAYMIAEISTFGKAPGENGDDALPPAVKSSKASFTNNGDTYNKPDTSDKNIAKGATVKYGNGFENAQQSQGAAYLIDGKSGDNGWVFSTGMYDEGGAKGSGAGKDKAWVEMTFDGTKTIDHVEMFSRYGNGDGGNFPRRFYIIATLDDSSKVTLVDYSKTDYPNYSKGFGVHSFDFTRVNAKSIKLVCLEPATPVGNLYAQTYDAVYWISEIVVNKMSSDSVNTGVDTVVLPVALLAGISMLAIAGSRKRKEK